VSKSSVTEQGRERDKCPTFDIKDAIQIFVKLIQTQQIHVIVFVLC